jgi:hypothetical protein
MSCVLRVSAPGIDSSAANLALKPYRVEGDSAHFDVSSAGLDDLPRQIEDAVSFLRLHKADLEVLMAIPGVSGSLDFGVLNRQVPAQFGRLSPELVCLAGKAGLGLELSFYSEGEGAEA